MREVKFRGLELMTGEWVYGSHLKTGTGLEYIVPQNLIANHLPQYAVDKDTVGQYTGLKDKNGVEIFEWDIVHFVNFDSTGGHRGDSEHTGVVKYQSGIYEIWKNVESEYYGSDGAFILNHAWLQDDEFEVIGNIYEHPHLLEVAQ